MLRKAGLLCAALAMFSIAGGHWAVVQSVAWAGMLAEYTQESGSVLTAIGQTFDGEHPCALCREIVVAKSHDRSRSESSAPADGQKFKAGKADGILAESGFQPRLTDTPVRWFVPAAVVPFVGGEAPPVPPPRLLAA